MTDTTLPIGTTAGEAEHRAHLRRAVIASTVGTTIEWYDFLIYSTMTGLVFGHVFFSGSDPLIDTLKAFGVFFIGFVARPIGAAIFGHYGDRIGRKATLIVTLLMTGIATAAVGLVPGYEMIGIWGAVILTLLRLIQGIGVGGEWGGSVLLAMEWASTNKNRGFIAAWPQFGAPAGLFLANLAVLVFSWISGDEFLVWGWRIPFLLSIVMVGVGLWIRLGILETPVFRRIVEEKKVERAPTIEVFRKQPKEIVLTALLRLAEQSLGYIWAPIAGALSDKIGRRQMYIIGCIFVAIFTFVYFAMLDTRNPTMIFIAVALSFIPVMTMYGPEAALIAEAFTPRLRFSGASIGYQLASIIAGGPAPFISTWLFATYNSTIPISIVATLMLPDYTNKEISSEAEYEGGYDRSDASARAGASARGS